MCSEMVSFYQSVMFPASPACARVFLVVQTLMIKIVSMYMYRKFVSIVFYSASFFILLKEAQGLLS